jgi:hypothetical protein
MTTIEDLRKTVAEATAVHAVVGATDVVVSKARHLISALQLRDQLARARRDFDAKQLQSLAQQMPSRAVGSGLHLVARAEEAYEDLAERGAQVLQRRHDRCDDSVKPTDTGDSVTTVDVPNKAPLAAAPVALKPPAPIKPSPVKAAAKKTTAKPKKATTVEPTGPDSPSA